MAGGRRMPLQNGSLSLISAIFVTWGVLLLYGPHGVTGQTRCSELWEIMEQPVGATCYPTSLFVYRDLQEDHTVDQIYELKALEGVTFTEFAPEGDPGDPIFDRFFSASLMGSNSISLALKETIADYTDFGEDGNLIIDGGDAFSGSYRLTYQKGDEEPQAIVIEQFQFYIINSNNKPPEFDPEPHTTSLMEDWPLNIEIPDLKVEVRDRDGEGTLNFSLDDGCPLNPIGAPVSITDGQYSVITFQLKTKLDYETSPKVTCTLTANDGKNEGSTDIVITVEAGQDEPPVFDNSFYYIDVENDASAGDTMAVQPEGINAVDGDDPPTAITYRMENAVTGVDGKEYFEINSATAAITLTKDLGDDLLNEQRQLNFVLFAKDQAGDEDKAFLEINLPMPLTTTPAPTTSTSTTSITTTPGGETTEPASIPTSTTPASTTTTHPPSPPMFRKDAYVFQALKGMSSMGTVKATVDGQDSTDIVYSLEDDHFEIVPSTGEVRKKENVEIEARPSPYEASVTAVVNGLSDLTLVKIVVLEDVDQTLSITNSLNQVSESEEQQDLIIGQVAYLPKDAATTLCVTYQEGVEGYDDVYFTFDESKNLKLKENITLDREREKQLRVWVKIFKANDKEEDTCSAEYKDGVPVELARYESLFIIDVEDLNDHKPTVDYPHGDITLAYPEDAALQKVVGPVIQLSASDEDDTDYVRYTIDENDKFAVDSESGAVFWEGEDEDSFSTSCGSDGCSFTVNAVDKDMQASDPVAVKVVSLPADNIYTMSFPDMTLSNVEDKLASLSEELSMDVRALYVTPKPVAPTAKGRYARYRNRRHGMRDGVEETEFDLDIHVSVLNKDGEIVTLDAFNVELVKHGENEAKDFTDKKVFNQETNENDNVLGYQIALGVTGGLIGVLLLAFVIMGIIRYRKRSSKRRGPEVPNLRRSSYSNQGYVKDDIKSQHDTLDGPPFPQNGSIGGFHDPPRVGGDSPPLNKSQLGVTPDSSSRGLRRTSPESVPNTGQPASREPPAQFKESTQQPQKETQNYTTALSVGSAVAPAAKKQPVVEPVPTQASSPYNTSNISQPRKKKDPPPLTAEPKKSALKGVGGTTTTDSQKAKDPQIALGSMAPSEPTADYDTSPAKTATSTFSNLKASPPPKKKDVSQAKVEDDNSDDEEDKPNSDVKKSNLKSTTDDSNDQDKKEEKERRKSSVAFKVLVEQKIIEPQNVGPAAKKQAKQEAKAEANQAAVDIMEANKKKLDDEDSEDDDNSKL